MAHVSNLVIDLIEASRTGSADATGACFLHALRRFGATAINARAYPDAGDVLDEQVFARVAPVAMMPVYQEDRFFRDNPLPVAARAAMHPFAWSDIVWQGAGAVWVRETMRDCGCPDGLIIPCHGPANYLGIVSLAFTDLPAIALAERRAIELAAHFVHTRVQGLLKPRPPRRALLTVRERDCLHFVSEGRTNAEIADAMGLSPATVATHLARARVKLGARTRAQAVAALLASSAG